MYKLDVENIIYFLKGSFDLVPHSAPPMAVGDPYKLPVGAMELIVPSNV